jgi:hypothetical protein
VEGMMAKAVKICGKPSGCNVGSKEDCENRKTDEEKNHFCKKCKVKWPCASSKCASDANKVKDKYPNKQFTGGRQARR